ncbi:MAG: hypothetical protein ACLQT7_06040 [Candidatus Dormibacteria bacterium]
MDDLDFMRAWARRRMIRRAQPLLPPEPAIRYVLAGNATSRWLTGILWLLGYCALVEPALIFWNPRSGSEWWIPLAIPAGVTIGCLFTCLVNRHRVIAATDDAIFVLDSGRFLPWTPRRLIGTYGRIQMGPLRGGWATIGDQRLRCRAGWWREEMRAADWDLLTRTAAPTGFPVSEDGRWAWHGGGWRPVPAAAPAGAQLSSDGRAWWDGAAWRVQAAGTPPAS